MYVFIFIAIVSAMAGIFLAKQASAPSISSKDLEQDQVMCTADAMQCPGGSFVGRTGPKCQFICPPSTTTKTVIDKNNPIKIDNPLSLAVIKSPLQISGTAIGSWFFEGSFGVSLLDNTGQIVASGQVITQDNWMTTAPVGFSLVLNFVAPTSSVTKAGILIFRKDNPSGLPQNDASFEVPIRFAP